MDYINIQNMLSGDCSQLTPHQIAMMESFCVHLGHPVPERFQLCPITSVAALLYWKVLLLIVARLKPREQEYWRKNYGGEFLGRDEPPEAYDAHFHLDRSLRASRLASFVDLMVQTPVEPEQSITLVGACASFCDPESYPERESF